MGSSGVGKSTLINALFNEELQETNFVSSSTGKGKHTTTRREMFIHPSGCMIIDSPGIRELQLWAEEEDLKLIYADVIGFTEKCRYKNCSHGGETGCAIMNALEQGELFYDKWNRYKKMLRELRRLEQRKTEYKTMSKGR